MQVADDGPGFSDDAQLSSGVGLSNTRARLQRLYGAAQKLVLENAIHGGAMVTLEIPFALATIDGHERSNENINADSAI